MRAIITINSNDECQVYNQLAESPKLKPLHVQKFEHENPKQLSLDMEEFLEECQICEHEEKPTSNDQLHSMLRAIQKVSDEIEKGNFDFIYGTRISCEVSVVSQ